MSTITFLLEANMNWIELKRKYGIDQPGGDLSAQNRAERDGDHRDARTCDLKMRELRPYKKGTCAGASIQWTSLIDKQPKKIDFPDFRLSIKKGGK